MSWIVWLVQLVLVLVNELSLCHTCCPGELSILLSHWLNDVTLLPLLNNDTSGKLIVPFYDRVFFILFFWFLTQHAYLLWQPWQVYSFYSHDAMLARVIVIATCPSVCPSVCLSVTRRYCVKTKKASGMISSPSDSPKTLVFRRQISSPNSKGFPPTGASNKGWSEKFSNFLALSVYISKTVADTAKVTISD